MALGGSSHRFPHLPRHEFWPTTRPGRWAVVLAIANVILVPSWRLLGPLGAFPGFLLGTAGGIVALVAIRRHRERSVSVALAVVPLVLVVLFVLLELLVGHS